MKRRPRISVAGATFKPLFSGENDNFTGVGWRSHFIFNGICKKKSKSFIKRKRERKQKIESDETRITKKNETKRTETHAE